jgi:tRNA-Thr(GGU) m(6)t(6)A37 methyltransferase TsaA
MTEAPIVFTPIGVIRTPYADRASAPRQPAAARGTKGRIELSPDGRFEHAVADLESFRFIWVLFCFHLNQGWRAKVFPPRSAERRGVFATRSPYRPNPIGMSVLRLEGVEGRTLHVLDVDMVDGTPLLDIKPYLPYADAIPDANHGWLDGAVDPGGGTPPDPRPRFEVEWSPRARAQAEFLSERFGVDLAPRVDEVLSMGPSPHPYRRIRRDGDGFRLAVKEWRVRFLVVGSTVTVVSVGTGFRAKEVVEGGASMAAHREFVERFGWDGQKG